MFWTLCSFVFQPFPTLSSCLAVEPCFSEVVHCRWSDTPAFFFFSLARVVFAFSGLYVRLFSLVSTYVRILRAVCRLWCSFCSFMCHLNLPNAISIIYGRGALRALRRNLGAIG